MSALTGAVDELGRIGAFMRRDFTMAWSYRVAFFSDAATLFTQALIFAFVGQLVDPAFLPSYGGSPPDYIGYVVVAMVITGFLGVGQQRLQGMIGTERYLGTLEAVIMTPIRLTTLQLGWLAYDLIYVPIRTVVFLAVMVALFGVDLQLSGAGAAALHLLVFLPFVWGLGAAASAATLLFRHGGAVGSASSFALTFTSGAFFPLELFPEPIARIAAINPVAVAVEGGRQALLGGAGLAELRSGLLIVATWSALSLIIGLRLFQAAFRRELDTGNIGLY